MPAKIDLTNQRFGKLTAVEGCRIYGLNGWRCVCDCGRSVMSPTGDLRRGKVISCGCVRNTRAGVLNRSHGKTGTKEYIAWKNMRARCNNPNYTNYKHWGGRGIKVDPRWDKFENFLTDMGPCPPGLTLERENNELSYGPGNCIWATYRQQIANRRRPG